MQEFATRKATAWGIAIAPKLNCFKTKYRYAVIVMKLTAILLLMGCLQLSARGISQSITLSVKDADLQTVFTAIEKQTDYVFFVNKEMLQKARKVTIRVSNVSLQQVLDLCFKDQPFTYLIAGKMITISRRNEKASIEESIQSTNHTGQLVDVKGRVVNESNDPVEGVNINVKGTAITTSTNENGEFALKGVEDNATLVFTSVNMEAFEIKVRGGNFLDVALQTKVTAMQEVVVNKGYYTEKQKLATGNVVSIKAKDIQNQPVNNPLLALVGRVPGVTIEQQTGYANSGIVVRVQGTNSINGGLEPLYVIDGVPYLAQPLPTVGTAKNVLGGIGGGTGSPIGGNPLSLINPNDIESIDILKDADATAIYGSRGANGVVLITTKKGKAGQTRVNGNFRSGWGTVPRRLDLLNTQQYLAMRKEGYLNDGLSVPDRATTPGTSNYDLIDWDSTRYTDWQKVLFGKSANYTDAQASISGGTSNTQFLISTGYHKETTVFPGDFSDQKGSFQFNISHASTNQKFKMQSSGIYVIDDNQIPDRDFVSVATQLSPNAPALYNSDGTLNWEQITVGTGKVSTWTNPLAILNNRYRNKASNLIGNLQLSYQLFKGLKLNSRFGFNNQQYDETSISPLASIRPEFRATTNRAASYGNTGNHGWIIEPQATYYAVIKNGKLEALIGGSFQQSTVKGEQVAGSGYSSDLLLNNLGAASTVVGSSIYSLYKYNAIFGRLNYNFKDRYLINATARRDGSSRFGSANLFQNFWSVAGSWIFSNESWFSSQSHFLNFGKLRLSYGTSGNDQIGDYQFMNLYNPVITQVGVPYQNITALAPNRHTDPYLQWEETNKFQLGLDLGFWNDKMNLNVNYYRNRSSNLLVNESLSAITGFTSIMKNFEGVLENTGWEINLSADILHQNKFTWTAIFNLTIPVHNGQLISFPKFANSVYANLYTIGKSINDVRVYHYIGVDAMTGLYQFMDAKGNSTFSPTTDDLIGYRNGTQKLFGGFQNAISYKSFELDFMFQGVKKKALLYWGQLPGRFFSGSSNSGNQPIWILDRWQTSGDVSTVQKFSATYSNSILSRTTSNFYNNSDGRFVDASFIRLTNLSLSWQIPFLWSRRAYLQNAKLFVQGQNLFTLTAYKGLDPSTGASSSQVLPALRIVTLGASVSF
jgi:TonB-linked SusC/RagA family outer membrane protein